MSTSAALATPRTAASAAVLPVILSTQLLIAINVAVVNVALTDIRTALGFSDASLSWVVNAYLLCYGGLLIVGGRVGDIIGRRAVIVAGLAVFAASVALAAVAGSPALLIAARALQGLGAALAAPAVLALIAQHYEGHARSRALGWFGVVSGAGLSAGMLAGGAVVQWLDWRWIFVLDIPASLLLLVLSVVFVPRLPRHSGARLDLAGAVLTTLAAVATVYGFVDLAAAGRVEPIWPTAFAVALVSLLALVLRLRSAADPLIPPALFAEGRRTRAFIANGLVGGTVTAAIFFISEFLTGAAHLAPLAVGAAFLFFTAPQVPAALLATPALRRFGARPVIVVAFAALTAGVLLLTTLAHSPGVTIPVIVGMVLIGAGVGAANFSINTTVMSGIQPTVAGGAGGLLQTALQLGGSIGVAVLVLVQSFGGIAAVFLAGTVFVVAAAVLMLAGRRARA